MKRSLLFHLSWIHVLAVILGLLLVMPGKNGSPSLMRQLAARVEGGGKPHYPIAGTLEERVTDFLKRHPGLENAPQEVADEENGFLLFREFSKSAQTSALKQEESLRRIIHGEAAWDDAVVEDYLRLHQESLAELRRIGRLPLRSVAGIPASDLVFTPAREYKSCSDALVVSLGYHLRAGEMGAAHHDFAALYGLAAHLDRHESPTLLAKTVGILIRLSANGALTESWRHLPAGADWSEWIGTIDAEPGYGMDMARVWRGEAYCSMAGLILPVSLRSGETNPIWDFTAFEDAYANRISDMAVFFEKNGDAITLQGGFGKLEARWNAREIHLSKEARGMFDVLGFGMTSWAKGAERAAAKMALMRASLELLQHEFKGEPVLSERDPRLAMLTTEPFSGPAFDYDPKTRRLSPAAGSMLEDEDAVELTPAANK